MHGSIAGGLSTIATIFAGVAVWLIYTGLNAPIALPAGQPAQNLLGVEYVANLTLMHSQVMTLLLGVGAAIVAAIFFTGAAVIASRPRQDEA